MPLSLRFPASFRMVLLMGQPDKDGTQHGEHVGLDERNKKFQTVHENHQQETDE